MEGVSTVTHAHIPMGVKSEPHGDYSQLQEGGGHREQHTANPFVCVCADVKWILPVS